jgi:hypothetical protein
LKFSSALNCGSVLFGSVECTAPIEASAVSFCLKSSGRRVWMSTVPVTPPSIRLACEVLCTSTELTNSAGSSV